MRPQNSETLPSPTACDWTSPPVPLLDYQRRLIEQPSRFTWTCWARQTGKSFTLSLRRVVRGMLRRRTQLLISAGMRQSRELMVKVQQHCQAYNIAASIEVADRLNTATAGSVQMRLPGGVRVIALPARPQTIRGYTGDILLDEFAMHPNDREIWAALFPTILRGGGELDIASTPKGCGNMFYHLGQNDLFARTTLTLPQAVAQGLDVDIQQLRLAMNDDELFRQEFLCEFLDESHAFLPYSIIAACEDSAALRTSTGRSCKMGLATSTSASTSPAHETSPSYGSGRNRILSRTRSTGPCDAQA